MNRRNRFSRTSAGRGALVGALAAICFGLVGCDPGRASLAVNSSARQEVGGVVCDEPAHHAGAVREGLAASHVFLLRNNSGDPREIDRIEKTCSCIEADVHPTILAPGATSEVRVSLQMGDVRTLSQTSANVYLKGFERPLTLALTAHVRPHLRVVPRSLVFGKLGYGETRSLTVRVHQSAAEAPELERVDVGFSAIRVETVRRTNKPPHLWEVTATLDGKDVTEPTESLLRLVRSDGEELGIPIYARPAWGFEAKPASPVLVVDSGPAVATVTVFSRDGFPFVIERAETSAAFVQVGTTSAGVPNVDHEFVLTVLDCPPGVELRGKGSVALVVRHYGEHDTQEARLSVPFTYWFLADVSRAAHPEQAGRSEQVTK